MSSRRWALCGALAALVLATQSAHGKTREAARKPRPESATPPHETPAPKPAKLLPSRDHEHAAHPERAAHAERAREEHATPAEHVTRPEHGEHAARTEHEHAARPEKRAAHKPKVPPRPERKVRPLPPNATWKKWRQAPWKRGYVTLAGHGKKWSGFLVDRYGDPIPGAKDDVASVLASWRTGKTTAIDDRLLRLIADVSDEFGGRPIRVVSGYREHSYAPDSRHKTGEAFDFSIPDVPNEALRDFLRSLPDVGVGYYPNSTHVHLDVREKLTYWIDYSRPGDRPMYAWDKRLHGMTAGERMLASALDALATRKADTTQSTTVLPHVTAVVPAAKVAPQHLAPTPAPHAAKSEPPEDDSSDDEQEGDGGDEPASAPAEDPRAPVALDAGHAHDAAR